MNLRTFLVFAALAATMWGQAPAEVRISEADAPAEVNQALRERVTAFYENHTGSVKRRAIDYVADDTQDYYFAAKKTVYKKYELKKIEYVSKEFDRAEVTVEATYDMHIEDQVLETTQPSATVWKIEGGKWYWTRDPDDPSLSPMSIFAAVAGVAAVKPQGGGDPNAKPPIDLKNLNITEIMAQQQRAILDQSKLDRSTVEFVAGKTAEQTVTLQNGFSGEVALQLEGYSGVEGLTATLEKPTLHARENGVVRLNYTGAKAQSGTVLLVVQPFNQVYPIQVTVQPK